MASARIDGFASVLAALTTMQSNEECTQKSQAHEFLEKFQKTVSPPGSYFSLQTDFIFIHYSRMPGQPPILCCHRLAFPRKPNFLPPPRSRARYACQLREPDMGVNSSRSPMI